MAEEKARRRGDHWRRAADQALSVGNSKYLYARNSNRNTFSVLHVENYRTLTRIRDMSLGLPSAMHSASSLNKAWLGYDKQALQHRSKRLNHGPVSAALEETSDVTDGDQKAFSTFFGLRG